jgi:putative ABC transport system permease protein
MLSAAARKSVTDVTRRRARTLFISLTLALAVASVGVFAVPSLMQQAMDDEIAVSRLADVTLDTKPVVVGEADLRRLEALPNVAAVAPRTLFSTRIRVGEARRRALVVGVPDFARQRADVVTVTSGAARPGALLTEARNAPNDRFSGDAARILGGDGEARTLPVSGVARTLLGGATAAAGVDGFATFYAPTATVWALSGAPGYTSFRVRLHDTSPAAVERTVAAVSSQLRSVEGFGGFTGVPQVRAPGDYPGKAFFDQLAGLLRVVTMLALLSALVLLANTMTTLIGEQTAQIAAMKAIGGTRRQIARIYRRTALLLGLLGAVPGVLLGLLLAHVLTGYLAGMFYGLEPAFAVALPVVAAALAVGLLGPPLAAMPAIRRAARLPLADALQASGSALGGQGRLDALLRRASFLPRAAQIGLRGAGRRKRRTLATALQVSLAVAALLALLSLSSTVGDMTRDAWDDSGYDVAASTLATQPFDEEAARTLAATPGVERIQPVLESSARAGGEDIALWGVADRPLTDFRVTEGRWPTAAEGRGRAPVAVLGRPLAEAMGVGVGADAVLQSAEGPLRVRVVGLSDSPLENGMAAFVPLATLQAAMRAPGEVNTYWVVSSSRDEGAIDRMTVALEDRLAATGTQVTTQVTHVARRDNVTQNANLTRSITVLGLVIVLISMVGLVNAITMGVLERTREIGTLRSIGARARDIRRIFATEGLAVALVGWLAGVPLGWLLAHGMIRLTSSAVGVELGFAFPPANVPLTLVGTVLLALLVLVAPVRRAVRFKPGEALRYA